MNVKMTLGLEGPNATLWVEVLRSNGHHETLDRDPSTVDHRKTCIELYIKAVKKNWRILCEFI